MQVFANKENIGALTKISNSVVQLAPSVITIGAKQYVTGALNCDLSTDLDTGSVVKNTKYYIYAVVSGSVVALKASTNPTQPLGFSNYKKVGFLTTTTTSQIGLIDVEPVRTQTKILSSPVTGTGVMSDLTFNNLEIGKDYEIVFNTSINITGYKRIQIDNGASYVAAFEIEDVQEFLGGLKYEFTASDSILTFNLVSLVNGSIVGDGTIAGTYVSLKQVSNLQETDEWV